MARCGGLSHRPFWLRCAKPSATPRSDPSLQNPDRKGEGSRCLFKESNCADQNWLRFFTPPSVYPTWLRCAKPSSSRNLIAPTKLGFVFSKERFATYLSRLTPAESKITPRSHRVAGSAPNPGCRRVLSEAAQRSSSIQAGAWSLEFSSPRTHRSTPPSTSRSDSTGERRK